MDATTGLAPTNFQFLDFFAGAVPPYSILRVSRRVRDRWQAARHSVFVICVSRSHIFMQSAKVLPPPPGALGADSLGLVLDGEDDGTRVGIPPLNGVVVICGDNGAKGEVRVSGEEMAGVGGVTGATAAGLVGRGVGCCTARADRDWASAGWTHKARSRRNAIRRKPTLPYACIQTSNALASPIQFGAQLGSVGKG
jgi:hypothetical protein